MPLINYIEPTSIGAIFSGMGGLLLYGTISYVLYRLYIKFIHYVDVVYNTDVKYKMIEQKMLDDIGKKKGIDLDKELLKRKIFQKKEKSFRKKLEEQVYNEMFGKEKEEEKKK